MFNFGLCIGKLNLQHHTFVQNCKEKEEKSKGQLFVTERRVPKGGVPVGFAGFGFGIVCVSEQIT